MSMFDKVMLDPEQGWLPEYLGCKYCSFYGKIENSHQAYITCKDCKGKEVMIVEAE